MKRIFKYIDPKKVRYFVGGIEYSRKEAIRLVHERLDRLSRERKSHIS